MLDKLKSQKSIPLGIVRLVILPALLLPCFICEIMMQAFIATIIRRAIGIAIPFMEEFPADGAPPCGIAVVIHIADEFLTDETGFRRWWVIPIPGKIDFSQIGEETNLEQFWGQCFSVWNSDNLCYLLTDAEREELENQNIEVTAMLPAQSELMDAMDFDAPLEQWKQMTVSQMKNEPCLYVGRFSNAQIGKALKAISKRFPEVRQIRQKGGRYWHIPPITPPIPQHEYQTHQDAADNVASSLAAIRNARH